MSQYECIELPFEEQGSEANIQNKITKPEFGVQQHKDWTI